MPNDPVTELVLAMADAGISEEQINWEAVAEIRRFHDEVDWRAEAWAKLILCREGQSIPKT